MSVLYVFVKPGAKSNSYGFDKEGQLWVRIAAPATENKANKACLVYLAELLKIKQGNLRLFKGQISRRKGFEIDLSKEKLNEILALLQSDSSHSKII